MTKLDKYLSELKGLELIEDCADQAYLADDVLKLLIMVELMRDALEFECGDRCARGINPCNARETLDKTEELVSR